MNRAAKVALGVLGSIAMAVGLFVWDTHARAGRAIQAHEARLRSDIAALRAKPNALDLIRSLDLPKAALKDLQAPCDLLKEGVRSLTYELARFGQESPLGEYRLVLRELNLQISVEPTPAQLVAQLAYSQEALREGGYNAYHYRCFDENWSLKCWKAVLAHHVLDAADLKRVSFALDQLLATRPTARDVLSSESVLDRAQVLAFLRTGDEPQAIMAGDPGWKELFSRSLLAAKALNELHEQIESALDLESRPILEREPVTLEAGLKYLRKNRYTKSVLLSEATALFQSERILLTEWALARVATAVARFQLDKGRDPADLRELVPGYLPEIPLNPYTGTPFQYEDGAVQTQRGNLGPQDRWEVWRR
jgi:hypothetical protein